MSNTQLVQLATNLEEIEKRLKAISLSLTASDKLEAVRYLLTEVKSILTTFTNVLDLFIINNDATVNDIDIRLHSAESEIDHMLYRLQLIDYQLEQVQSSGILETAGGIETTNWTTAYRQVVGLEWSQTLRTEKVYLYSETTEKIKIKARIKGDGVYTGYNAAYKLYANGTLVDTVEILTALTFDVICEYEFFPTQKINYFECTVRDGSATKLDVVEWEFCGRNVFVFNRDKDWRILMFNNTYYLTKNEKGVIKFLVQDANDLDFTATTTDVVQNYSPSTLYSNQVVGPFLSVSNNTLVLGNNYKFSANQQSYFAAGEITTTATSNVSTRQIYCMSPDAFAHGLGTGAPSIAYCNNTTKKPCSVDCYISYYNFELKYNGESFAGEYYNNVAVKNNNLVSGCEVNLDYGYIIQQGNKMNFYVPNKNSTYMLELGVGRNATAFYQTDESINVYLNLFNDVIKYNLVKNQQTDEYEINTQTKISNCTEYIEGYNNKAIIRRNGELIVIDIT